MKNKYHECCIKACKTKMSKGSPILCPKHQKSFLDKNAFQKEYGNLLDSLIEILTPFTN